MDGRMDQWKGKIKKMKGSRQRGKGMGGQEDKQLMGTHTDRLKKKTTKGSARKIKQFFEIYGL